MVFSFASSTFVIYCIDESMDYKSETLVKVNWMFSRDFCQNCTEVLSSAISTLHQSEYVLLDFEKNLDQVVFVTVIPKNVNQSLEPKSATGVCITIGGEPAELFVVASWISITSTLPFLVLGISVSRFVIVARSVVWITWWRDTQTFLVHSLGVKFLF